MAKSIRSKVKRKNRSEFRSTIGEVSANRQSAAVNTTRFPFVVVPWPNTLNIHRRSHSILNTFVHPVSQAAYQANMEKVQHKLKECVEKQSLESLEKLSGLLDSSIANDEEMRTNDDDASVDIPAIYSNEAVGAAEIRGENKAPTKKLSKRRKHKLARKVDEKKGQRSADAGEKPRPRFFCQF